MNLFRPKKPRVAPSRSPRNLCKPWASLTVGAVLLSQLAACSRGGPGHIWSGTISDSSGIVIVTNPEEGIWPESEAWSLEEELRIGSFGGDLNYQFGQIGTIALNSQGDILVSDLQAQDVRTFSSDGMYLGTFGGPGSGPGELGRAASVILITPGDTALVVDGRNRRINRYGPDGSSHGSTPLFPERERPLRFKLNVHGGMAAQLRPVRSPDRVAADTMDAIVRIEASGAFSDTLLKLPTGGLFESGGLRYFTSEPMWDITDSLTVIYGVNSEYRIGYYDQKGTLRRVITKPFEPARITERDIRAIFFFLDQAWLDAGVPPSRLERNHQTVGFAEFFPTYFTFEEGPDGTLWVQRVKPPGEFSEEEMRLYNFQEDFGAADWDVFDRKGRYLGLVEMPRRFQPRVFMEDKIYGVWRDELDVQYVIRLRIVSDHS